MSLSLPPRWMLRGPVIGLALLLSSAAHNHPESLTALMASAQPMSISSVAYDSVIERDDPSVTCDGAVYAAASYCPIDP